MEILIKRKKSVVSCWLIKKLSGEEKNFSEQKKVETSQSVISAAFTLHYIKNKREKSVL